MARTVQAYFAIKSKAMPLQACYRDKGFHEAEAPGFPEIGS